MDISVFVIKYKNVEFDFTITLLDTIRLNVVRQKFDEMTKAAVLRQNLMVCHDQYRSFINNPHE